MEKEAPKKIPVWVVDLDGSLADTSSIIHHVAGLPKHLKNYEAFHTESAHVPPIPMVQAKIAEAYAAGNQIVIATGRKEQWRQLSADYYAKHNEAPLLAMHMRADDDNRGQVEFKTELIDWMMSPESPYDVKGSIEDRPALCEHWRSYPGVEVIEVPGWE